MAPGQLRSSAACREIDHDKPKQTNTRKLWSNRWWQGPYETPAAAAAAREGVGAGAPWELSLSTEPYEKRIQTRTALHACFLAGIRPADTFNCYRSQNPPSAKLRERELESHRRIGAVIRATATRAEMLPDHPAKGGWTCERDGAALGITTRQR